MGRLAKILSFVRTVRNDANVTDVKVDPGGGANITAEHFSAPGDDSFPLETDYVHISEQPQTGREVANGYLDPINVPKSTKGEKRIYARDSAGISVVELWLKSDGSAILSNANGFIKLASNGTVDINGVTIDSSGNIISPTSISAPSIVANSKELAGHDHLAGTPPGNTGPNN